MRRPSCVVLGLVVVALALTGCSSDVAGPVKVDAAALPSQSPSPSPSPEAPSPSPSLSPSPVVSVSPSVSPTPGKPSPKPSPAVSYDVVAVQRQLTELKYYAGPVDGRLSPAMKSAVMAFQKVQG
ncbi:MAG: peptidoglycan-binding protein, partial [Actinomycetota bacterium]|nr:peptidoglycan-binding protein [Actinomycetota bacterium]